MPPSGFDRCALTSLTSLSVSRKPDSRVTFPTGLKMLETANETPANTNIGHVALRLFESPLQRK